jgi:hypothetical protein
MKTLICRLQKFPDGNASTCYSIHVKSPSPRILKAVPHISYTVSQLSRALIIAICQLIFNKTDPDMIHVAT